MKLNVEVKITCCICGKVISEKVKEVNEGFRIPVRYVECPDCKEADGHPYPIKKAVGQ